MATQGMVTLVRNGKVAVKIVAGCNGGEAKRLADHLKMLRTLDPRQILDACVWARFGCEDCLVVQTSATEHVPTSTEISDEVAHLYRDKFSDPNFNPRWECGECAHCEVVDITEK